jgi:hypothetical protein
MKEIHASPSELGFDLKKPDQYFKFLRCLNFLKQKENEQHQSYNKEQSQDYIDEANILLEQLGAPPPEPDYLPKVIKHVVQ